MEHDIIMHCKGTPQSRCKCNLEVGDPRKTILVYYENCFKNQSIH